MINAIGDTAFGYTVENTAKMKIRAISFQIFSECYIDIGLPYEEVEIDTVHRIG